MATAYDLEPIDVYGNWKVKQLRFPRTITHGLKERVSTFKIRNSGSRHVLVKKAAVDWNGDDTVVPLIAIPRQQGGDYGAGFRLKAKVKSGNQTLEVLLGSTDAGKSLRFDIRKVLPRGGGRTQAGSFGTAGRGG